MIQRVSAPPSRPAGGIQLITQKRARSGALAKIQGRRRPDRPLVRSERKPTIGSVMASQALAKKKIVPTSAVEMPSSTDAYFMYMMSTST